MCMSDGEIAGVVLDVETRDRNVADAPANIVTMGRTVLALTREGSRVALLEHERVRFVGIAPAPLDVVEIELIERRGAPRCNVPCEFLT